MSDGVVVIGAGGHASVVLATLQAAGVGVEAIVDDDPDCWGQRILGVEIRGPVSSVAQLGDRAVLAIGSNRDRMRLAEELSLNWLLAVHPTAVVHSSVTVGPGAVIFAGAVIQPNAQIGSHAIINTGVTVDHHCQVGDFSHIAPGVNLAGGVCVGAGVLMGIGSCATPGVEIGDWATVGAGSIVVENLASRVTAVGCPAKAIGRGDDR